MKFTVGIISLITIYVIPSIKSQGSPPSGSKLPGSSGCIYYGPIKEDCGLTNVPLSSLPKECSSILYYELLADEQFNIKDISVASANDEYMKSVADSGKPAFIYHGHGDVKTWAAALACNAQNGGVNAKTEVTNLKNFLDQYPGFTGIILAKLSTNPNGTDLGNLNMTADLKVYIDELKSKFPDFGIGLDFYGFELVQLYGSGPSTGWLDFSVLDPLIDFYTINTYNLNDCTDEFKNGGNVPVTGDGQAHTLTQLSDYLVKAGVSKTKTYYVYRTQPLWTVTNDIDYCPTKEQMCANASLDGFCMDNTQSYYDKGKFAKENGAGFIAMNIDLGDDPNGCCNCGRPFPGFYDMLDGYNGSPAPASCPLLDKI